MTRMRSPSVAVASWPLLLPLLLIATSPPPPAPAHAFQISHQVPPGLPPRPCSSSRAHRIRVADTGTSTTVSFEDGNGKARRRSFTSSSTSTRQSGTCTSTGLTPTRMSRSGGEAEDVGADATDVAGRPTVSASFEQTPPPKMSHPATDEELSAMDAWLSSKMREENGGGGGGAENRIISTTTSKTAPPRMSSPATDEELSALDAWLTADEDEDRGGIRRSEISRDGQSSSSSSLDFDNENMSSPPPFSSRSTEDSMTRVEEGPSSESAKEEAAFSNRPPQTTPSPPRDEAEGRKSGEDQVEVLRRRRRVVAYGQRACAAAYAAACSASLTSLGVSPRSAYAAAGPFLASGLSHVLAVEAAADDDDHHLGPPSEGVFEGLNLGLGVYAAFGMLAAMLTPRNRNPFWVTPCILSLVASLLGYKYGPKKLERPEAAVPPVKSIVRNLRAGLAKVPGCNLRSRTYLAGAFATGCMALVKLWETVALIVLGRGGRGDIIAGKVLRCAKLGLLTAVTLTLGGAAANAADRGDDGPMMGVKALATLNLLASVGFGTLAAFLFHETTPLTAGIGGSVAASFALFSALDGVASSRTRSGRRRRSSSNS